MDDQHLGYIKKIPKFQKEKRKYTQNMMTFSKDTINPRLQSSI
jgi:hypothetical protein